MVIDQLLEVNLTCIVYGMIDQLFIDDLIQFCGFFLVKSWTSLLTQFGFSVNPFTRQENTVIQTCVVACYGLSFSGGFGSYLIVMNEKTYNLIGLDYPGNRAEDAINPGLWWMMGFLFVVSFLGLFSLVPLRKVMVMDYKLTYPSGTATAMLINNFHTTTGAVLAGKQVKCLGEYLSFSLYWGCFTIKPNLKVC
ncbi:probable metal-nicotianamine transporter YSL6 [Spinacia oleracea]|uniref:Probable metal-nicotianamine transporter YSL6 n=1 Tax=Spinacia oleracea TaxID=3562 RepID=A0ABM3RHU5_SPIOL|nr:probable metal-nicotianamine transporter YSL6 [Spinacia oleracea]